MELTSEQLEKLSVLRSHCVECTESPEDEAFLEEKGLVRLLYARNFSVDSAFEMWKHWVDWRKNYGADQLTYEQVQPIYETGKAFWNGHDKYNRPCLIIRVRCHWPGQFDLEDTMRFIVYLIEQGLRMADEAESGQLCVIYDRGNVVKANRDPQLIETVKKISGMLQDYYAERLAAMYILHVNWFYYIMFQAMKPFINKSTRKKLFIVRNVNGLREHFEEDQLMEEYGGTNGYVHSYPK